MFSFLSSYCSDEKEKGRLRPAEKDPRSESWFQSLGHSGMGGGRGGGSGPGRGGGSRKISIFQPSTPGGPGSGKDGSKPDLEIDGPAIEHLILRHHKKIMSSENIFFL